MTEAGWIQVATIWGPMGIVLLFLGICIWRGGKWLGLSILLPMKERHFRFLDVVETTQGTIATALANLQTMMATHDAWERERAAKADDGKL